MKLLKRFWNWLRGRTDIDDKAIAKYQQIKQDVQEVAKEVKDVVEEAKDVAKVVKSKTSKRKPRNKK